MDNIQIQALAASATEVSGHAGKLVPTDYSIDAQGDVSAATGTNRGSVTVYPAFAVFFLLDDSGEPLEWSILLSPESDGVTAGSSAVWDALSIFYEGSASGIRVHFDYSLDPPSTTASLQAIEGLSRGELLDLREQRARMLGRSAGIKD